MAEIHHATPGARRRLVFYVLIGGIGGLILIKLFQAPALKEWLLADPRLAQSRLQLLIAGLGVLLVPPAIATIYMARLAARIVREQRFPPEGIETIHDVLVVRGGTAVRRGRALQIIAAGFMLAVVLAALTLWRLVTLVPQPK